MNTTTRRVRNTVITAVAAAAAIVGLSAGTGLFADNAQAATPAPAPSRPAKDAQSAENHGRHGDARIPRVVAAWADAWNAGDPEKMAALFTKDGVYQDNAFQVTMSGHEGVATWVATTEQAVRDAHVHVVDAFRDGDRVAVRWNFSGTDTGAFAKDRPATGKSFNVPVTSVIDLKGDKIQHVTDYYNLADVLRQVGLPAGVWTPPGR